MIVNLNKVTIISKKGCHICENVIEDFHELSSKYLFDLEVLDILDDQSLFDKYLLKIPVVRLNGEDIFEVEEIAIPKERKKKLESMLQTIHKEEMK